MTGFNRTAIRRLSIQGYRSIRALELTDLPDLVVLHGPNGAGKSNLLLAVQLILKAAAHGEALALGQENALALSLKAADQELGLRPDDFHHGAPPEIRIVVEIALGGRAAALAEEHGPQELGTLRASLVIQRAGEDQLRLWFEQADIRRSDANDHLLLRSDVAAQLRDASASSSPELAKISEQIEQVKAEYKRLGVRPQLEQQRERAIRLSQRSRQATRLQRLRLLLDAERERIVRSDPEAYFIERLRTMMLPRLLQVSPAYRVPGQGADPQQALFDSCLSEQPEQRAATRRLGQRLARAGLFGAPGVGLAPVALIPVESKTYTEKQIRLVTAHGEVPLRNLGSGEQQVVYMLAQRVITPFPISLLEEPEAHLHTGLMDPFARVLLDSVAGADGPPDVDQLWIATHHHQFALALEYFDVRLVNGATEVRRLPRAKAAAHFFEPGPIWEALRQLASSARERDAVVFRDASGEAVTAAQILDSIEKDPEQRVARDYARAMTEAMVQAMRQRAERAP